MTFKPLLKKIIWLMTVTGLAFTLSAIAQQRPLDRLGVATWGGAYTRSQVLAYMRPYTQMTGLRFNIDDDYRGGLQEIREQVVSLNIEWDVVDLELSDAVHGCEQGLLEKIDHSILPPAPDGTPATEDFLPDTLQECAVGTVIWSTMIAYDADGYEQDSQPKTLADFFDVQRFPGKRGLRQTPQVNLEWALMADGVPADEVYQVLSTPQGLNRAFNMLNKIRNHILWWDDGATPPKWLSNNEVAMTSTFNGRIYDPIVQRNENFGLIWDGQVINIDLWGITRHTMNREEALDFIRFSTSTQQLANQAKYIPYGPARRSSMALVPDQIKPFLPTYQENYKNALHSDFEWWAANRAEINRRFERWLAQPAVAPEDLPR